MKKLLAVLTSVILVIGIASFAGAKEGEKRLTNPAGFVYKIKDDGTAIIVGYEGSEQNLVIPETFDSITVTEIGNDAFRHADMKTLVIPGCIKRIRQYAFVDCFKLTSVEIQEGVERIDRYAFFSCNKTQTFTLPSSISEMGDGVFYNCSKLNTINIAADHPYLEVKDDVLFSRPDHRLIWYPESRKDKEYTIPDGTEIIGEWSFGFSKMAAVVLPESITNIHEYAFAYCKNLKTINFPRGITSLKSVLYQCDKVERIIIPEDHQYLQSIDDVVFNRDPMELVYYPRGKKDKNYIVPDGTTKVVQSAFENTKLVSVEIPGSVKVIENVAFGNCKKLKKVILHEGVESFGPWPFEWCTSLTEISLPASLTKTDGNPFKDCSKLKTVSIAEGNPVLTIIDGSLVNKSMKTLIWYPPASKAKTFTVPEGVEIIDECAFEEAKINELIVPEGVVNITYLSGMKKLRKVYLPFSLEKFGGIGAHINASKIVFMVIRNSYAEKYCKKNDLKYEYYNQ